MNTDKYQTALEAVAEALAELSNQVADSDLSPEGLATVTAGRKAMAELGQLVKGGAL